MSDPRATPEGFDLFVREAGLETCRRAFAEEMLLFSYFERPAAAVRTPAGAPADGGDPG